MSTDLLAHRQLSEVKLAQLATKIRINIIKMLTKAGSGHSAGSLGMTDVLTALYFGILRHRPTQPGWVDRDRVILSNGHICPVWYATLAAAGYFPEDHLWSLREIGSPLQGHPHLGSLPGIENTAGPLGQGLSQACGLAYALKLAERPSLVYALLSDGEHQEGQTWEAYQFAAKYRLHNLTALIDRNGIQIEGDTEDVMPLEPLATKLEAFGWHVQVIDGHSYRQIIEACQAAQAVRHAPSAIICQTIAGRGVEFMEGKYQWHGQSPDKQQAKEALRELRSLKGQIVWE